MQISNIITKTGDNGTTSLWNGTRVLKSDPRIMFGAQLDNLNAAFGITKASLLLLSDGCLKKIETTNWIEIFSVIERQNQLIMGEILSGISHEEYIKKNTERFDENMTGLFENYSRKYSEELNELGFKQKGWFSYGDDGVYAASLDCLSRQIRSFELYCWQLKHNNLIEIREPILIYFNRMSDYIYILARYIGVKIQQNYNTTVDDTSTRELFIKRVKENFSLEDASLLEKIIIPEFIQSGKNFVSCFNSDRKEELTYTENVNDWNFKIEKSGGCYGTIIGFPPRNKNQWIKDTIQAYNSLTEYGKLMFLLPDLPNPEFYKWIIDKNYDIEPFDRDISDNIMDSFKTKNLILTMTKS